MNRTPPLRRPTPKHEWRADDPFHDPCTGYSKKRCRCDRCKAWSRDERRKYRARARAAVYTDEDAVEDIIAVLVQLGR